MLREALFYLSEQPRLQAATKHTGFARRMARRFVAGETLEEAIEAVRHINAAGMIATLDELGEHVHSSEEALDAVGVYIETLQDIADAGIESNVSLKLTQLGLDMGEEFALGNLRRVVEEAARLDNFIRIDMESSAYVDRTLDVFQRLFATHKNVGVVIQSMLYRSESDIEHLSQIGARVRLVKGAYLEPPEVAYQRKRDVDESFLRLMGMLLLGGNYPAIATHDPDMLDGTIRFAREHVLDPKKFEFQMLYGIRRDLQASLVRQGFNVRIYVPYGTHWYPYLMRRMAERPSNLMFVLTNVARERLGSGT